MSYFMQIQCERRYKDSMVASIIVNGHDYDSELSIKGCCDQYDFFKITESLSNLSSRKHSL